MRGSPRDGILPRQYLETRNGRDPQITKGISNNECRSVRAIASFSSNITILQPRNPKKVLARGGAREVVSASAVSLRFLSYTWAEAENLSLRFLMVEVLMPGRNLGAVVRITRLRHSWWRRAARHQLSQPRHGLCLYS